MFGWCAVNFIALLSPLASGLGTILTAIVGNSSGK